MLGSHPSHDLTVSHAKIRLVFPVRVDSFGDGYDVKRIEIQNPASHSVPFRLELQVHRCALVNTPLGRSAFWLHGGKTIRAHNRHVTLNTMSHRAVAAEPGPKELRLRIAFCSASD